MVSLQGAEDAQPYVTEINKLQAAFDQLGAMIAGNDTIWQIVIQAYAGGSGPSSTVSITNTFSEADSAAILNDIKNIIGNTINVLTNELGQIT
jgi:hypothetical protein